MARLLRWKTFTGPGPPGQPYHSLDVLTMSLTLNDLILTPELRTRVICGAQRCDETVSWAHVCELADPSEWLGKGDLLMTTGIGIPADPGEQRLYVERLHVGGLAGLMIGDNMQAPADIDELFAAAKALGFPVLMTEYGVPFSAVTKAVVNAYKQLESNRRNAISQVYETARISIQGLGLPGLLKRLEADVGAVLHLVDPRSLNPWMAGLAELPALHREAILQRPRAAHGTPIVQRCAVADGETVLVSVPSHRRCLLAAHSAQALDYGLLHHIVAVIGIELERLRVDRETKLRQGGELIDDLLHKRVLPRQAEERLEACGADVSRLRLAVARLGALSIEEIDEALVRHGIDLILRVQGEEVFALFWADETVRDFQSNLLIKMGVSDFLEYVDNCANALREARLALAHATENSPLSFYSDTGVNSPWLPQSLHDATEAFRRVLGPLTDYDVAQGAQLLHTLRTFLENNRSWINTANKLHIHKQTLVYRVRRIEEITARSLDSTDDVAILWFALKAADIAGISNLCTASTAKEPHVRKLPSEVPDSR